MTVIVDTNVAWVASGRSEQASEDCVATCVEKLEQINNDEVKLALDRERRIIDEYQALEQTGRFNIGYQFYK